MSEVTRILEAIEGGDGEVAERLLPLVYEELRGLAAKRLAGERAGQTLEATALVHEAYLRLVGHAPEHGWAGRAHFFAAAATAMRRILIERARRKRRRVHGGGRKREELRTDLLVSPGAARDEQLIALDEALGKLAERDPVKARLVELRYFAGLSGDAAAEVLGISPRTADRYWVYARAWLRREMEGAALPDKNDSEPDAGERFSSH